MEGTGYGIKEWKCNVPAHDGMGSPGLENEVPYVDDIIIGSTGENMDGIMANHEKNVRAVLNVLRSE